MRISFVYFTVILILLMEYSKTIKWVSIKNSDLQWNTTGNSRQKSWKIRYYCNQLQKHYGFSKGQGKICRKSPELIEFVRKAAILSASTCQHTFQQRRWNCSSINNVPVVTPDLTRATREQAFVYAITSAALAHTMAKACSSGLLRQCSCTSQPQQSNKQFKWGGCGDNTKWGAQFAKRFSDPMERNKGTTRDDRRSFIHNSDINLHNNNVGRKMVFMSLAPQCKCHGMSGSCSLKTCWKALPRLSDISKKLLRKYITSIQVSANYTNQSMAKNSITQRLIYATRSPDYCLRDDEFGSVGTQGRRCNKTSTSTDNCKQLCCGRGYRTLVEETIERCQCKYYYCCYVKCKSCLKRTHVYECL